MFETAFRQWVLSFSQITNLIQDRFYIESLPQNPTYPCCVYSIIGSDIDVNQSGSDDIATDLVQINCYHNSMTDLFTLTDILIKNLHANKGQINDLEIYLCTLENKLTSVDDLNSLKIISLDFLLKYKR